MTFPAWQCMTKYRVTQKYIKYGHNHSYTPGFTVYPYPPVPVGNPYPWPRVGVFQG